MAAPWRNAQTAHLTTSQRGYGTNHVQARKAAAKRHRPTDPCCRCGQPLGPMGPWLHYDHNAQRTGYLGFAHRRCNERAGRAAGRARQARPMLRW